MANYPLAALMSTFANVANIFGQRHAQKQALKDRLQIMQEMEIAGRPGAEAQKKRTMLMSMGIDPDTGQPIPEFWKAKEQAHIMAQKYKKGKGGKGDGKPGKKGGKSAAERQREADEADAASGGSDDGNWFTSLFK